MRYRNEALRLLQTMPSDYSLGDVLYAVFQKEATKNKVSLSFLRELKDEDIYTKVEQVLKAESAEEELTEEEKNKWITR